MHVIVEKKERDLVADEGNEMTYRSQREGAEGKVCPASCACTCTWWGFSIQSTYGRMKKPPGGKRKDNN